MMKYNSNQKAEQAEEHFFVCLAAQQITVRFDEKNSREFVKKISIKFQISSLRRCLKLTNI